MATREDFSWKGITSGSSRGPPESMSNCPGQSFPLGAQRAARPSLSDQSAARKACLGGCRCDLRCRRRFAQELPDIRQVGGVRAFRPKRTNGLDSPDSRTDFLVTTDVAEVLYKATDYYAPEYERTLLWNDPKLGIPWPLAAGLADTCRQGSQGGEFGIAESYT